MSTVSVDPFEKLIREAVDLRHLGTLKMDGQGIFDGFYALNLGSK